MKLAFIIYLLVLSLSLAYSEIQSGSINRTNRIYHPNLKQSNMNNLNNMFDVKSKAVEKEHQ